MDRQSLLMQQANGFELHNTPTSAMSDAAPSPELPAAPFIREEAAQQRLSIVLPPSAVSHFSQSSPPTLGACMKLSATHTGLHADAMLDGRQLNVNHTSGPGTEGLQRRMPDAPGLTVGQKRSMSDACLGEDEQSARKRLRQDEPISSDNQLHAMVTVSAPPSPERTPSKDTNANTALAMNERLQQQPKDMALDVMDIWLSACRGDVQTIQAWLDKPGTDVNAIFKGLGTLLHAVSSDARDYRNYFPDFDSDFDPDSDFDRATSFLGISDTDSEDERLKAAEERHGLPECKHNPLLLKLLLSRSDIDANTTNYLGQTPLMIAVKSGSLQNVQALLAWPGINVNKINFRYETALESVTDKTPPLIVDALLAAQKIKANCHQYLDRHREFISAAAAGKLVQLLSLLAETPWININFELNGERALGSAAQNAHIETVQALLDMDEIKVVNPDAKILANLAVRKGYFQLFRDMLDSPYSYGIRNTSFFYPYLELAAADGCFPIVEMLLFSPEIYVNIGRKNKGGNALLDATINEHYQIAIVLASMPWINVNATRGGPNNRGKYHAYPVLAIAAEKGNLSLVRALLAVPTIDVNQANESGHTSLMLAAYRGHLEIVHALLAMPKIDIYKSSNYIPYWGDSPEHLSGVRLRQRLAGPPIGYTAFKLGQLGKLRQNIEALRPVAGPARPRAKELNTAIPDAHTSAASPASDREQIDPQRACWLEQSRLDISRGNRLASDVRDLLQSTLYLPAWCQSSLVEAIALGFILGHYHAAPPPPGQSRPQTRTSMAGLACEARQSRQDVIELDAGISQQIESMKLLDVFSNEMKNLQSLKADPDNAPFEKLTRLSRAARDGNLPMMKTLVALGANIHLRSPNGDVPIVAAARAGQWAACAELLSLGAMPVMGDNEGYPALYYIASAFTHPGPATPALAKLIRYLRLKNVRFDIPAPNPDERDRKQNPTVLISDILFSNPESWIQFGKVIYGIADELGPALPMMPTPQSQPVALPKAEVHAMVQLANPEAALAAWLDADPQHLQWRDPENHQSLLHLAAASQNIGLVQLLLDRGIARTHVDRAGQTAAQLLPADYMSSHTPNAKRIKEMLQ